MLNRVFDCGLDYLVVYKANLCPDFADAWSVCIESKALPLGIATKRFHKEDSFYIAQCDLNGHIRIEQLDSHCSVAVLVQMIEQIGYVNAWRADVTFDNLPG